MFQRWSFDHSFFKDYKLDSRQIADECFEFDWGHIKIPRLPPKELAALKKYCKDKYHIIKDLYRYAAGIGREKNLYQISFNIFNNFMVKMTKLIDQKQMSLSESDSIFFSLVRSRPKDKKNVPPKGIIRFQFLEACIRIALRRYYESGMFSTPELAMEMMIDDNFSAFHQ